MIMLRVAKHTPKKRSTLVETQEGAKACKMCRVFLSSVDLVRLAVPAEGHTDHTGDFGALEGLEQYVVAAQIQNLSPKLLVGVTGNHHNRRRMIHTLGFVKNIFPVAVGEI